MKPRLAVVTRRQFLDDVYRYFNIQQEDTVKQYEIEMHKFEDSINSTAESLERMARQDESYSASRFRSGMRTIISNAEEIVYLREAIRDLLKSQILPEKPVNVRLSYWLKKHCVDPRRYICYYSTLDWTIETSKASRAKLTAKIQVADELVSITYENALF
jgi:hypothetical protein